MTYESLLEDAAELGVIVKEVSLISRDGHCRGKRIAIDSKLPTSVEKTCVLAEELGHYRLTVGDITDQSRIENRKQELIARNWAYEKLVGIVSLINAYDKGIADKYELIEYLGVTEHFLCEALNYYSSKYGTHYEINNYIVYFSPNFGILKMI